MPHIENRWTWGNILTLAGVAMGFLSNVVLVVWWAATVDGKIVTITKMAEDRATVMQRQLDLQTANMAAYDRRLRDAELGYVRLDEKVTSTLDIVREVRDVVKAQP